MAGSHFSGKSARRPVHVVYGGAHLYSAGLCRKLGDVALRSLEQYAPSPEALAAVTGMSTQLATSVYPLVIEKLRREPVEDYRIDFEDGYGHRADAEEDAHADSAAAEAVRAAKGGLLPPFFGIRVKSLEAGTRTRSLRTLKRFLLAFQHELPADFVVTLPKVSSVDEVQTLLSALGPRTRIELMVETPAALRNLRELVSVADGRVAAVHFGPYDYTSSLGIIAAHQSLSHPACDFARGMMQVALADEPVGLADGPTTLLPIAPHRGDALTENRLYENRQVVHQAWSLHYANIRRSLIHGFYQGWDLHPAQLPMRYAANFAFFHEGLADASRRLRNFLDAATHATRVGAVFDDAATGQALLNFFLRGLHSGAIHLDQLPELAGLSVHELETGSFARILGMRRTG